MAIRLINSAGNGSSVGGTAITITHGFTLQPGDVILCFMVSNTENAQFSDNNTYAFTSACGGQERNPSGGNPMEIFYRVYDGNDESTFDFTQTASTLWGIAAFQLRGVDPDNPFDVAPGFSEFKDLGTSGVGTSNSITTSYANSFGIVTFWEDSADSAWSAFTEGYTEEIEVWDSGTYRQLSVGYKANLGAVGSKTGPGATQTGSEIAGSWHFAMRPLVYSSWTHLGDITGAYDTTVGVENVSLTPLGLQEGDLVVIAQSADSNLNTLGLDRTQGYTIAYAPNDTSPGRLLAYKVQSATPDTSVNFNDGSAYHNYIIQGWRAPDSATPLDVSMPTEATGSSINPDSPSITPATVGALVLSVFHLDDDDTTTTEEGQPAGYRFMAEVNTGQASSTLGATTGIASKQWESGPENPGQWTLATSDAWAANTIAFRPSSLVTPPFIESVERVTIDWDATSEPVTQNLSKSQTYTKCVPFFTKRLVSGSVTDDWRERTMKVEMIDNAGTPAVRVTASGKSSANDHRIEVYVVEFGSDITVQQVDGDIIDGNSSANITIADVTAQANAFFMYSYQYTHGSAQDRADYGCVRPIWNGASTTSVTVERTGTVGTIDGMLYVVSCASSEFSVQHRDISVAATDELTNDTISAVPIATSFLLTHFRSSEAEDDPLDWSFVADLSSTTNVRVRRSIAGASNAAGNVGVQVVTCSGGQWDVQRGDFTTTSNLTATTTFSAVDLTRSFVKTGTHEAGLNSLGTSDLAAGTIVDEVGPSAYLSANNTITWTRESVSETGNTIPWEVIQFSAGLDSFIYIPTGPLR